LTTISALIDPMHLYRFIQWLHRMRIGFLASVEGALHVTFNLRIVRATSEFSRRFTFAVGNAVSRVWLWVLDHTIGATWFRSTTEGARSGAAHAGALKDQQLDRISRLPVIGLLARMIGAVSLFFLSILDFLWHWFSSRSHRQLLKCIPAFLLASPLIYFLVKIPFFSGSIVREYRSAATEALQNEELATADLYLKKVELLGGESVQQMFARAIMASKNGKYDEALAIMNELAPDASVGIGEAHLWIANALLFEKLNVAKESEQALIEHHLKSAYERLPNSIETVHLLSVFYKSTNQTDEALTVLGSIAPSDMSAVNIAKIAWMYNQWGQHERSLEYARLATEKFEHDADERDQPDEFFWWSKANFLHRKPLDVLAPLVTGLEIAPDEQLATSLRELSQRFLRSSSQISDWREIAEYLLKSCDDEQIQLEITSKLMNSNSFNEAFSAIKPFAPKLKPSALSVVGDGLTAHGEYSTAKSVYRRVLEMNPKDSQVANNLAWLLAQGEPADLEPALAYSNQAIELQPNDAEMRETRGQILLKLKRWDEATADLTIALNSLSNNSGIHAALAECYAATGRTKLAQIHRDTAATMSGR
jgi:tetratricopeptide (TPR) repeat protein